MHGCSGAGDIVGVFECCNDSGAAFLVARVGAACGRIGFSGGGCGRGDVEGRCRFRGACLVGDSFLCALVAAGEKTQDEPTEQRDHDNQGSDVVQPGRSRSLLRGRFGAVGDVGAVTVGAVSAPAPWGVRAAE